MTKIIKWVSIILITLVILFQILTKETWDNTSIITTGIILIVIALVLIGMLRKRNA